MLESPITMNLCPFWSEVFGRPGFVTPPSGVAGIWGKPRTSFPTQGSLDQAVPEATIPNQKRFIIWT